MTPTSNADLPLRGIHLPDPISWWPPAIGWFIAAGLVVLAIGLGVIWWVQRQERQRSAIIRQALAELDSIAARNQDNKCQLVQDLSALIRRVAMQQYGRTHTASLTGASWTEFLKYSGKRGMSDELARALSEMPYRPVENVNSEQLVLQVRQWIDGQVKPQYRKPQHV